MNAVDKHSVVPYYYQLADLLRQHIKLAACDGQTIPLPSEFELAKTNQISRATVRQALALLEREGLIFKARGKGTFITRPRARYDLTKLVPTTDEMLHRGWQPGTTVISLTPVHPSSPVCKALELDSQEPVHEICRIRLGNGEPVCLQWSYIPVSLCPDLAEQNLEESLTDLMDRKYKIQFSTANVILRARTITPYEAKHLDVPPGSPVIYIEQITYSQTGQAVEFIQSVWRSDRYEFSYTAARTGWPLVE